MNKTEILILLLFSILLIFLIAQYQSVVVNIDRHLRRNYDSSVYLSDYDRDFGADEDSDIYFKVTFYVAQKDDSYYVVYHVENIMPNPYWINVLCGDYHENSKEGLKTEKFEANGEYIYEIDLSTCDKKFLYFYETSPIVDVRDLMKVIRIENAISKLPE